MAREFNRNLFPPGGYVFTDTDGSRHRAEGWRSLERKIAEYRTRNGRPVGNVWQEIMDQVCATTPGHCHDNTPRPIPPPRTAAPSPHAGGNRQGLAARVLSWIGAMLKERRGKRLKKVARTEAVRRAKICAACPMQAPLLSGCPTCSGTISSGRKAILEGESPADDSLQGCTLLIEDTKLSVHLQLPPSADPNLPANCWRRNP